MREILLHARITDEGNLEFAFKRRGFEEREESVEHLIEVVGILENAKQEILREIATRRKR